MDPIQFLSETDLFGGVAKAQLESLRPIVRARKFHRESFLFREGDAGSHLYVVTDGEVKIARVSAAGTEIVFGVIGPGGILGEISIFESGAERSADALALIDTECLVLPRDAVIDFLRDHPELLLKVITRLAADVRRKDEAIAEVAYLDIAGRLANKLLELAASKGRPTPDGVAIDVPLSQRLLAGMVGAGRENVNRALHRFVQLGYIAQSRATITVLKPDELRRRGSREA
jgi:CRP-like cAMP-binding protein